MTLIDLRETEVSPSDTNTRRIALRPGEYWWGGVVEDGAKMPFRDRFYHCDMTHNIRGNQATPLLISSHGRFVWSEQPLRFTFDERDGGLTVASDGAELVFEEGHDDLAGAYRSACRRFFLPSGQLPDPLNFLAPQYNSWIEMQYEPTQSKVLEYARGIRECGFPPGVLMIDDNWFEHHGDWRFHTGRFPDPGAMVRQLHDDGFRVMLWISPFISPDCGVYRELERKNLLVLDAHGAPIVRAWWNGQSAMLDLSNPSAVQWLTRRLDHLVAAYGVDGFKFDAGDPEYIRAEDVLHGSMDALGYCQAWAEIGLNYRFNEYRACWKLAGQPLVQRLRDRLHTWGSGGLADIVPNGLAQGLAGYGFTCPDMVGGGDIGSFSGDDFQVDQELFVRTLQASLLFPIVQFSLAPWRVLDAEHLRYCRDAVQLRQSLAPEILALAERSARTGEPILRHMSYVFPHADLESVQDQFLLGDSILVAPVTEQGARSRRVAFPDGSWRAEHGEVIEGPCVQTVDAPLGRLPWFRRVSQ
ncbi:glycosyl hydrolase family 31 [Capsulimonas corticalis]|uniref:Glycosyl hydrolase family 31 n=1 Tax=Capsulimonas corticalis TaxID=2219043 RepID=A0A402CWS7_9BACT|nr:glycoside hydrolase family 31 protein [Capsulimonas corticalis]BDI34251.1 glycosyl hydrolase family 31 [Capsulimonas corticalis]